MSNNNIQTTTEAVEETYKEGAEETKT